VLKRLRNPFYFALAMALPGLLAIFGAALPQSDNWGRSGWLAFAVVAPAYLALYLLAAFVSFIVAALVLRLYAPIAVRPLMLCGLIAGAVYLVAGYLLDPLWQERYFLLAWAVLAFASALYALARWGKHDA